MAKNNSGYQELMKYSKDQKERELLKEDTEYYMKVASALRRTIAVQEEIDAVLAGVFTS